MFAIFSRKKHEAKAAEALYDICFSQARHPGFYRDFGVPDTIDGRFELLLLHEFMLIERLLSCADKKQAQKISQALFDETFVDMEQSLREAGIGDMGVPKRQRRMMLAFNGRMHAYKDALEAKGAEALEEALERNLYGTVETPAAGDIQAMAFYVYDNVKFLVAQGDDEILSGALSFKDMEAGKKSGVK